MRCAVPDPIIVLAVDVAGDGAPPLRIVDGVEDGILDPPPHGDESTDSAMSRSASKDLSQHRPLARGPSRTIFRPILCPQTSPNLPNRADPLSGQEVLGLEKKKISGRSRGEWDVFQRESNFAAGVGPAGGGEGRRGWRRRECC